MSTNQTHRGNQEYRRSRQRLAKRRMQVESLEGRAMMTVDLGGNSLATAANLGTLQSSREILDWVGQADTNDYYQIRVDRALELRLGLDGLRNDADLQLLRVNGQSLASSTRGGTSAESINRMLEPGDYAIRVYRFRGDTPYRLAISATFTQSTVPDGAGNSMASALNIGTLNGTRNYSDFVGNADRDDYYRFSLNNRSAFEATLSGLQADADVQLLDASGSVVTGSTLGGMQTESIRRTLEAGTYFVRVYRYSGDTNYAFTLRAQAESPPAVADNAGNTMAQARDLGTLNGTVALNDWVGSSDTADYYRFRAASRGNFRLTLDGLSADADVQLVDAGGRVVGNSNRGGTNAEAIDLVLESGTYVAYVYPYGGANTNYRLSLALTAASSEGWASQTLFNGAETSVQRAIVQRALAQVGGESPASQLAHSGGRWVTDVGGGDGQRIRNAFNVYHQWRSQNTSGSAPTQTLDAMHATLLDTYRVATQRTELVNRIVSTYENRRAAGLTPVPTDDAQVLEYLGIRQQCVEWANASVAMPAGGGYRGYGDGAASVSANQVRPGMALLDGTSHYMIITDVYWDANGQPTQVRVAESNMGNQWSNPAGQRPWERVISSRNVNVQGLIGGRYSVVSFE